MPKYDYYRTQIQDTIEAGVVEDDHFRVKVFGKRDSKFMTINIDQMRCLADVMDETNPPSLLPLQNGHRVLRADVRFDSAGMGLGHVIADVSGESAHEFVVWTVYLHKGESRWLAENGDYCSTIEKARASFDDRRGVNQPITVWVAHVEYEYGSDSLVGHTEDEAKDYVHRFVTEWWAHEKGDELMPTDRDAAIAAYFDPAPSGESYTITSAILDNRRNDG